MNESLPILYRDDYMVAVHKPAGLLVHRSPIDRHETRFALQMVRDQIGQWVYPVHRLDKPTSGVLLFALSAEIAGLLGKAFAEERIKKDYLAVVRGWPPLEGLIDHPIRDDPDPLAKGNRPELALPARTYYRRLATVELPVAIDRYPHSRYALLHVMPQTGRRHQIRKHLKHIAHPIIGDAKHGKGIHNRFFAEQLHCSRLLLACTALSLEHPVTGELLKLEASLEGDFARLLTDWGIAL